MAVNSIATIAIRMVVTTCPRPRSLSTPNTDMGATGWITMMPYRLKSQSVSERLRRGPSAGGLAVELIPFPKNETPLSYGDNGVRGRVTRGPRDANSATRPQFHKILSNSIRKRYSVNEKTPVLKRLSPSFGRTQEIRRNSSEFDGA